MRWSKALCALSILFSSVLCLAQDITDVEAKPYGSYTGGAIDTVDLATGNLMLNIPLISYPQLGTLPALSFSVELNNAPYSQSNNWTCDADASSCELLSSRYDTSPPGGAYQTLPSGQSSGAVDQGQTVYVPYATQNCSTPPCAVTDDWGKGIYQFQSMGAYLTSSYEGGIVTGQFNMVPSTNGQPTPGEYEYSLIDPSGTTHELESDYSSWNTYRAPDGSGYTFLPNNTPTGNAYFPNDPENQGQGGTPPTPGSNSVSSTNYWLATANSSETFMSGVRLGTVQSPNGIQYADTIVPYSMLSDNANYINGDYTYLNETLTPRALMSTVKDPSGNTVTRGPWYWSGYWSTAQAPNYYEPFQDIWTFYGESPGPPYYTDSVGRRIPDPIAMQATQYGWTLGGGTPSMVWQVPGQGGNNVTYKVNYTQVGNSPTWTPAPYVEEGFVQSPPDPSTDVSASGWGISSIVLPNNTTWAFSYATATTSTYSAGDLITITTPSNGTITYQYTNMATAGGQALPVGLLRCNAVCHAVQSRAETDGEGNSWTTTYSYAVLTGLAGCPAIGVNVYAFSTTETDNAGNATVHSFCGMTGESGEPPVANQYHEILTQYYQGSASSGVLLKSVQTAYEYRQDINPTVNTGQLVGAINVLPTQTTTSTPGYTTTVDSKQYSSDQNNSGGQPMFLFQASRIGCLLSSTATASTSCTPGINQAGYSTINISYLAPTTDTVSADGTMLRKTSTTFEFQNPSSPSYLTANLIALPLSVQVAGEISPLSSLTSVAGTTTYGYDETNQVPGAFGNLTSTAETYSLPGNNNYYGPTTIRTTTTYNNQGMPITKTDANYNTTTITYGSSGLFPYEVQRPTTNGYAHIDYYSHDLYTSELLSHTDENNQTTQYSYDAMGRVTSIQYPDHGGSSFCYTDAGSTCTFGSFGGAVPFSLYTSTTASPDPSVVTAHTYDGWGRQIRSKVLSDPLGATTVDTTYDWDGRVASASNPYRSLSDSTYGTTSYIYDALGRKTIQTQPDGSTQQWCYDGIATASQAFCPSNASNFLAGAVTLTDVSDEAGRHSQQIFDGLGRLSAVMEPDPSSASSPLAMETDYQYDVFGDLLTVNGVGGGRYFAYDIPSRVTYACNPETLGPGQEIYCAYFGMHYLYDGNSNLIQKEDNRETITWYEYDALSRLLSKTYWYDGAILTNTAVSCYQYDGLQSSNLSGRLATQWTQAAVQVQSVAAQCPSTSAAQTKTSITAYDPMGRVLSEVRCAGIANCASGGYAMSYSYDLAGKLAAYPSGFGGFSFANSYDASGRLFNATSTKASQTTTLFSAPSYTPAGALSGAQLGAAITLSRTFDSRQRVTSETDSSTSNVGNVPGAAAVVNISGSEQSK